MMSSHSATMQPKFFRLALVLYWANLTTQATTSHGSNLTTTSHGSNLTTTPHGSNLTTTSHGSNLTTTSHGSNITTSHGSNIITQLTTSHNNPPSVTTTNHTIPPAPPTAPPPFPMTRDSGLCQEVPDTTYNGRLINCTGRGLTRVDQSMFAPDTTSLILDGNNLTALHNSSLSRLTRLRFLSIRYSNVQGIQVDFLFGLSQLEHLDLEGNSLPLHQCAFPRDLFRNTPSLRRLYIAFNTRNKYGDWEKTCTDVKTMEYCNETSSQYPEYLDIFEATPRLEALSLDSLPQLCLGAEFAKLPALTNLTLYCASVEQAFNSSLVGLQKVSLRRLELVQFSNIIFSFLPENIFQPVQSLEELVINKCQVGNHNTLKTLWPFVNGTLRVLKLNDTKYSRYSESPAVTLKDGILTRRATEALVNICLHTVALSNNKIFAIEPEAFISETWERCLQTLDLSGNQLGLSSWRAILFQLHLLSSMEDITLTSPPSTYDMVHHDFSSITNETSEQINSIANGVISPETATPSPRPIAWIRFPPKVRYVRISYLTVQSFIQFRCTWRLVDAGHVRAIYAVNIPFFLYSRGRLLGLENLQIFDVTGSMMDVEEYFYDDFPGIEVLVMSAILPVDYFNTVVPLERLLRNMSKLRYLDLSNNQLNSIPRHAFRANAELRYLILSKNRFSSIPFDVQDSPHLTLLDLSDNAILHLTEREMWVLERQLDRVGQFTLRLSGNGIVCLCSTIKFVAWLQLTNVRLDRGGNYTCTSQSGKIKAVAEMHDVMALWRPCVGSLSLTTAIGLASTVALTFLSMYLGWRFKTSLMAYFLQLVAPQFRQMRPGDYEYQVFVGYADDDFNFVKDTLARFLEDDMQVKTFLHQRDLGIGYADQLFYDAIQASWRVLLVLTDTFLRRYDMANILMKYASLSVSVVNQGRVFVLLERSQIPKVPSFLLDVLDDTKIVILDDVNRPLNYEQKQSIRRCLEPI
ncbi:protein slit-like [Physella acuta]|uniref:protein slit-like n=1 Tax=Physella acuta TaxID=109671 RepID=UPI0027DE29E4|nr:protein slit-like [Physella acuta]